MSSTDDYSENDIAIVGMSCRFPGASSPQQYWDNLRSGRESLTELNDEQLRQSGVSETDIDHRDYVKAGMFLDGVKEFDAGFFGFSPRDASILDPQHRHFLECSWEAFDDAGYNPFEYDGAVGVFAGSGHNAYFSENVMTNPDLVNEVGTFLLRHTGNDKDFLATRVSYLLNLHGPSINVQTACSTSLVAMHLGVQSLLNSECDMVLAGGVTINLPARTGYRYKAGEILSPDGHCRPFDASSGGTVFGSGVGCVLLKRYSDAVSNRDNIHAVIKGSAVNNDGSTKISYLAPSIDGQVEAIQEAIMVAEIEPDTIGFVECHGTGTQMGDPIEVAALTQGYDTENHQCAIGSVKGNIGHTDTAAGVASLIKAVESLKNKQIPPTLHFKNANPELQLEQTPFYVNTECESWHPKESPRRAAVSSLGVGGTNAHLILQEFDRVKPIEDSRSHLPILLSAITESALHRYSAKLSEFLDENRELSLEDVAWTLGAGRAHFPVRQSIVASSVADVVSQLDQSLKLPVTKAGDKPMPVVFMFAGGGTQYRSMGIELYQHQPVYRDAVDQCIKQLQGICNLDLAEILFADSDSEGNSTAIDSLSRPSEALPALFVTQYAQACLWQSWGVEPAAMIGHSMGENTAACVSGVFSLKDALGLVVLRGQLFERVEAGGMLSVSMDYHELLPLVESLDLDIAAVNANGLCVASGSNERIDVLAKELDQREQGFQRIHIDVAAHSRMLESVLNPFRDYLLSIQLHAPSTPFVSNVSGDWITDAEATDPEYWVSHLRQTVQFAKGFDTLEAAAESYLYLEVGPGKTLTTLSKVHLNDASGHSLVTSMPHADAREDSSLFMSQALTEIWRSGGVIDWSRFYSGSEPWRVSLPAYSFDHSEYWIEPAMQHQELKRAADTSELLYQPTWQRNFLQGDLSGFVGKDVWLLADESEFCRDLTAMVNKSGATIKTLTFESAGHFRVDGAAVEDLEQWAAAQCADSKVPDVIIHALAVGCSNSLSYSTQAEDKYRCFDSMLELSRALGAAAQLGDLSFVSLTRQAQSLVGEPVSNPLQALLHGASRVMQSELSELNCCVVDLPELVDLSEVLNQLLTVITSPSRPAVTAMRGGAIYSQFYQRLPAEASDGHTGQAIKDNGVYLITGGHGGIGLAVAEAVAQAANNVSIVLASRTALPPRDQWGSASADSTVGTALRIEGYGATVYSYSVDLSNRQSLEQFKGLLLDSVGTIDGIFHAAGVTDDNLIMLKTDSEAQKVLDAKVASTIYLSDTFQADSLDFMVLFSSVSAFSGLIGQFDYAAANSFLDGFAHYQHSRGNRNVISIDWPAWKETGMALAMLNQQAGKHQPRALGGAVTDHPMLDVRVNQTDTSVQYKTLLSTGKHWMLNEHRLASGAALIPGSGFIELARAAFFDFTGSHLITIEDAMFLQPLIVEDDDTVEMTVQLSLEPSERVGEKWLFSITTQSGVSEIEHATGSIFSSENSESNIDLSGIADRCNVRTQLYTDEDHHPNLRFGDRWASLQTVQLGASEALISLELDDSFAAELSAYALHPAMLDMATAGAHTLAPIDDLGAELYVPIEYGSLQMSRGIPSKAYSHVVLKQVMAEPYGTVTFDVNIVDVNGQSCVVVRDFVMKKISSGGALGGTESAGPVNAVLERTLELGVKTDEALVALFRLINIQPVPQVIVSPFGLDYLLTELDRVQQPVLPSIADNDESSAHDPDADPAIVSIEKALGENPAIDRVVVRSFLADNGGKRLMAWFACDDWDTITVSDFRKFAKESLDTDSLPQSFIELDEMPLDDEGAIDRSTLLDPFAPVTTRVAPRTDTEKNVAAIWAEVLGTQKIGVSDNFFDIGGHSLLSIRVILRIKKNLAAELDQAKMALLTLEQVAADIDSQFVGDQGADMLRKEA